MSMNDRDIGLNPEGLRAPKRISDYRRRRLISVGVGDYRGGLSLLRNAVNDACLVYQILTRELGFTGSLLCRNEDVGTAHYDPVFEQYEDLGLVSECAGNGTREDILDALDRVAKEASEEDLFVFFYSGHGSPEGRGYLIPYGATLGDYSSYLMYETLGAVLDTLPCLHQMLIFDCCYAGTAAQGTLALPYGANGEARPPHATAHTPSVCSGNIVLAPSRHIIAATDSFTQEPDAFDRFAVSAGKTSVNSPFTHSLAQALQALRPGAVVTPAALYASVDSGVRELPRPDQRKEPVLPVLSSSGAGHVELCRPGIHVDMPNYIPIAAGTETHIPLRATGTSNICEWSLESKQETEIEIGNDCLRVKVNPAGEYRITVRAKDSSTGLIAEHDIDIVAFDAVVRPPRILTANLEPCLIGQDFRFMLQHEGGRPPVRWSVENLPDGLTCSKSGELFGFIHRDVGDARHLPAGLLLRVKIEDAEHRCDAAVLRLAIVDLEDYCEVPGGRFLMGYAPTPERAEELRRLGIYDQVEHLRSRYYPSGTAFLPRYFIKRTPATNREWREFIKQHPEIPPPAHWSAQKEEQSAREAEFPVTGVSYEHMLAYCAARGTRLPTGPEWEKAARGTDGRLFPWGDTWNKDYCNNRELYGAGFTRVDQFPQGASPCGALDMAGNAWELVHHRFRGGNNWHPSLRGGSFEGGPLELLACHGSTPQTSVPLRVAPGTGALRPARDFSGTSFGFRDVIELDDAPPYPQGWVRLDACSFYTPGDRKPIQTQPLLIARYTVSNEEYWAFVRARHYRPPAHWDQDRNAPFPHEERFFPVVNVSYEDACAFCKWKSEQLGFTCAILTEPTWRAALHGPASERLGRPARLLPWGNAFESGRCNGRASGLGGLCRVFDYPEGCSACGCFNLLGNVAEWVGAGQVAGGSWEDDCKDPARWLQTCTGPRYDVGFRYYALAAAENARREQP